MYVSSIPSATASKVGDVCPFGLKDHCDCSQVVLYLIVYERLNYRLRL